MRKVANIDVINVVKSINEYKSILDPSPAKLTYGVSKHEKTLVDHIQDYEAGRINLCKGLCIKDGDGNPIMTVAPDYLSEDQKKSYQPQFTFTDENMESFTEALLELQQSEVEVPDFKCSADVLDKFQFSPAYFPSSSTFFDYFIE